MSKFRTRIVDLAEPRKRAAAQNSRTVIVSTWGGAAPDTDFRQLFLANYSRIRQTCLEFAVPGLAVFAIHPRDGWAATMYLASRAGELRAGVVGRHSAADLFLGDDTTLALRHLIFLVEPPRSLHDALRGEVRFRVLDLNTDNPPTDEAGHAVESLTAEGTVFLTCQEHAIMAFVTGDPTDWPESASDAWDGIPERVFVEERLAVRASGSAAQALPARAPAGTLRRVRTTIVRTHPGPQGTDARLLGPDEPFHARIEVSSTGGDETLSLGREALRQGILVGRYDRCHASDRFVLDDPGISRVHLLIIEAGGHPYAIDIDSTNGTYDLHVADNRPPDLVRARVTALGAVQVLALGPTRTSVTWLPATALPDTVAAARAELADVAVGSEDDSDCN